VTRIVGKVVSKSGIRGGTGGEVEFELGFEAWFDGTAVDDGVAFIVVESVVLFEEESPADSATGVEVALSCRAGFEPNMRAFVEPLD